jgi:hypothetical protein
MIPRARATWTKSALFATLVATLLDPCASWAVAPLKLGGAIEGRVSDTSGQARMGAVVQVYNRQEKLIDREMTDDEGFFVVAGLSPDIYSVRVSFANFVPVLRDQISVQAGQSQLLNVNLSGLFSSIHLLPPASRVDGLVNQDWKWVLRSSSATRPVFRFLPDDPALSSSPSVSHHASYFTDNRGLVSFSAGDLSSGGPSGEVGTAFAFATNMFGANNVQFAGDVAYAGMADAPSAAVRTTYSRNVDGDSPEISVTLRQLYIPRWTAFFNSSASESGPPPLRSVASNMGDKMQLTDTLVLDYGVGLDTIAFVDRIQYFSPYARLTWTMQDGGKLNITYTSGNARPDLRNSQTDSDDPIAETPIAQGPEEDLQRNVAALASPSAITLINGHARAQRGEDYEIGYARHLGSDRFGSRDLLVSVYREDVQNAALMISGADSGFAGDLIPDVATDGTLFNGGNYHTMGYSAGVTQHLGDNYRFTIEYGSVGVLSPRSGELTSDSPAELRSMLATSERQVVTAIASATIPHAGTHFQASYQLIDDGRAALVARLYSTQGMESDPGLTIAIRQPIPPILGLPFRMEATAEIRNMLAQGYLPVSSPEGRLLLVQTPRVLRGGVSFHF